MSIAFRGGAAPVLNSLATYLASLPPGQTASTVVLCILTPVFVMILGGFAWTHFDDTRAGR